MRPVLPRPRRTPTALLAAVAVTATLAGCGGDDDTGSPFKTPKGESKAAASLGIPVVATRNTTRTATGDPVDAAAAVARAAFPGGSDASRAKAVAIVDKGDWRVALAASALVAPPVSAPLLFSDGTSLPDPTEEAVEALDPSGGTGGEGAQALRIGDVGRPSGLRTENVAGEGPYELARAIDRYTTQARGRTADRVLVVSADRPEFAIPAAAWLAKSGDPVAFVTSKGIPAATARQLAAHPKATLYVLGPSAVVRPAVTKQLRRYGTVKRMGGVDPVQNAVGFARYKDGAFGWNVNRPGHGFTLARSTDTLGAITLAPLAASGLHGPLLLTDSANALPEAVAGYLLDVKPGYYPDDPALDATQAGGYNRAWITGDVSAIDEGQQAQLDALLEIAPVDTSPNAGETADSATRSDRESRGGPGPTTTGQAGAATPGTTTAAPTPRP
ncbi:unannotated protein [freshwater metagenome]|uniref:Unannotated protein n=1 Tax=freshwater metagenome TaxID=449393 RepID=A0A6J7IVP7_9ZZZZ|nr:hypothetical protein [Actinomycetota bacterium]